MSGPIRNFSGADIRIYDPEKSVVITTIKRQKRVVDIIFSHDEKRLDRGVLDYPDFQRTEDQTYLTTTKKKINIPLKRKRARDDLEGAVGEVTGLPEVKNNKYPSIIVTEAVAMKLLKTGQWDGEILVPDEHEGAVRDKHDGHIIGTTRLLQYMYPSEAKGISCWRFRKMWSTGKNLMN